MYYADLFLRTHTLAQLVKDNTLFFEHQTNVATAGRIFRRRLMGKTVFIDIVDFDGKIQCYIQKDEVGEEVFLLATKELKIGDIIGVCGTGFVSNVGENTLRVKEIKLLVPTAMTLPDKFHGLTDVDSRYRQRYLDLIANQETRDVFKKRFDLVRCIRRFLDERGFTEVETPILQKSPCGASANPFKTRHLSKDIDLYLRISPEAFLKQLVVAGMDRVYEIGKNFRNEGTDRHHLQEFTMLEFYASYCSYKENVVLVEDLFRYVVEMTNGSLYLPYQEMVLDFSAPWRQVTYRDLVLGDTGIDVLEVNNPEELLKEIDQKGIDIGECSKSMSLGTIVDKLYKKTSRPKLIQPTILMHHPAYLLPLARLNDKDPRVVDAFQVIINGWEMVKAYSELADPVLQRSLLEKQSSLREGGDDEAMFLDQDFLLSLEYGLPPVSGVGVGIDRLVAIITNQRSLNDVVLFPIMR